MLDIVDYFSDGTIQKTGSKTTWSELLFSRWHIHDFQNVARSLHVGGLFGNSDGISIVLCRLFSSVGRPADSTGRKGRFGSEHSGLMFVKDDSFQGHQVWQRRGGIVVLSQKNTGVTMEEVPPIRRQLARWSRLKGMDVPRSSFSIVASLVVEDGQMGLLLLFFNTHLQFIIECALFERRFFSW
jgi:hypothetical protein